MGINIEPIIEGGVSLKAEGETVTIEGSIDCAKPGEFMSPFLNEIHNQTVKNGINELKIDFRKLSFLNSSAISEFTDLILRVEELPTTQQYKIRFICDIDNYAWQKNSIATMMMLNDELISMENGGN